ncbi:bromodomain-containing protein 4B-like [Amphibalanus amphitrite]|uniref:bromodomain-containing protein 4B-like n=1 Tax=Amphibalanus amphitrite TaxID=1232801 RepID=UPI001C915BD0|nr:bromodomain-containing protein 4B-like [Amphibalanus amphitrite]
MPVPVEEPTVHTSVRQAISFFGGAAKHPKSQLTAVALPDQQRLPAPQATRDDDSGGRTTVDVRGEAEQLWPGHDPRADGVGGPAGRPRFLSLDPGDVYEAFDGQRSGLLKPSQLAHRRAAAPARRPSPPPDYRPTDWAGLTKKAFLWSRFSDEDRRLVLQTPRGRRRSVPAAETRHRADTFEAAFHKFQELGCARPARGRGRPAGSRPPPPALVPIWLSGGLSGAVRWPGSGESRTSSSGTPEGSPPLRAAAGTPDRRSVRSDGSGSGSGCGSGSDLVFPAESPDRAAHRRLSSPGPLARVCLVPTGPGSHQESGSAAAVAVSPAAPRPASMPPHLPVSSALRHSGADAAQRNAEHATRPAAADTERRGEAGASSSGERRATADRGSDQRVCTPMPELHPIRPQPAPRTVKESLNQPAVPQPSSPARLNNGDIEIGLESDERPSAGEESDGRAEDSAAEEDKHGDEPTGEEGGTGAEGDRPPPPPRRRVQVERHNSEVHLRLSRSSEQMIRQLERIQYEPGQTDEDGVELKKKKPKSFRRKLKEVLRRAKEDEALLQDFTEYLVVVRPDKMILKRVGEVSKEEPPLMTRAARGRGGRHPGQRRPHTTSVGPDDVFSPRRTADDGRGVTPPPSSWCHPDEEVPFSPRYGADGSPASTASKGEPSEGGSPPPRESLVDFISRYSQRPRLEARRRCRQPPPAQTVTDTGTEGSTTLPPPAPPGPGQSHSDNLPAQTDVPACGNETTQSGGRDKCHPSAECTDRDGERTPPPPPPPPPTSSPVQSPDSTQAGERPAAGGYDVSRYTESITPPAQAEDGDDRTADDGTQAPSGADEKTQRDGGSSEPNHPQTEAKTQCPVSETNRDGPLPAPPSAAGQTQVEAPPVRPPAQAGEPLGAPLSPPNITITRVSRPARPPSSPPSEAARQALKRPGAPGQTLPLKKRRLETAEQKAQRCRLLEAASDPQTEQPPRRAHHLDMALVKGYEFLFQPPSEEHAITRILNPSFEPSLAMAAPPPPGDRQRHPTQARQQPPGQHPHPQQYQHQQPPIHQPQPHLVNHHHHPQPPLPQPQPTRPQRAQPGGQQPRGKKGGSGPAGSPGAAAVRHPVGTRRVPLPAPPLAAPYPALPLPPPASMSPSVHALFEAYERAARRPPEPGDRRAFRLYEPAGVERHRPPLPPPAGYSAGWQHHLQLQQQQQQQQMELHHQQWLQQSQQERQFYMQREQQQQVHQQQQHMQQHHLQQLQLQKQQQQSHPRHDHQMQLHHQQQQLHHYQHHYQPVHQPVQQPQHEAQRQSGHQGQPQPQQQALTHQHQQHQDRPQQQQVHQHLQQQPQQQPQPPQQPQRHPSAQSHPPPQPALQGSASSAALSGSWGAAAAGWCPQDPAQGRRPVGAGADPAVCYPCPEYQGARRHVYPTLGEPWAPVGPVGWPPRPGAL